MKTAVNGMDLLDPQDGRPAYARAEPVRDPQAMSPTQLERWLFEISEQPLWRREADKCCDYYDTNQITTDQLVKLEERDMGPLISNYIAPTINAVLGMEAKTRTDWRVGADDDAHTDVADALSSKLHEAERESHADQAVSEGYAQQIKAGFGCLEISRNSNPFEYRYRVQSVHRREIWWDWRSVRPDWSDARYVVRKRWFDADQLAAWFPKHIDLIKFASSGWHGWTDYVQMEKVDVSLAHSHDQEQRIPLDDYEWRDTERGRVACYEVWYRVWIRGLILRLPGDRVVEFDQKNPMHRAVVATGMVQPQVAVYDKLRCAFYIGPHRLRDVPSDLRRFPYVPFFGYREDLTGVPYGLIRAMISPQDEINTRRQKMMWLLSARRTFIDNDAVDKTANTLSDVSRMIARANAFIVTNPGSAHGPAGIRVDDNMQLAQQQFQVLEECKETLQQVGGVYAAMLGSNSNASSGLAIQSLVEQGTTTLAEINDNYRMARRLVGEALLNLVRTDLTQHIDIVVDNGLTKRRVMVNIPVQDPKTGQQYKQNDVQRAPVKIALEDVPATPTYRAQQFAQLTEVVKSLPPQQQAFVVPFIIEASDMPQRRKIAELLRKQLGLVADPSDPKAQAAQQEQQAVLNRIQELMTQLNMRKLQADVSKTEAQANKLNAEAQKAAAPTPGKDPGVDLQKTQAESDTKLEIAKMHEAAETERAMIQAGTTDIAQVRADLDQLMAELNEMA